MSLLVLSNLVFGATLGARFGVLILIPLMPAVLLELLAFEHTNAGATWPSAILHGAALIAALDVGYLVGMGLRGSAGWLSHAYKHRPAGMMTSSPK